MKKQSLKYKIYIAYFVLSWPLLAIEDNAPLWIIALVVLNFGNAVRLINNVPKNFYKESTPIDLIKQSK